MCKTGKWKKYEEGGKRKEKTRREGREGAKEHHLLPGTWENRWRRASRPLRHLPGTCKSWASGERGGDMCLSNSSHLELPGLSSVWTEGNWRHGATFLLSENSNQIHFLPLCRRVHKWWGWSAFGAWMGSQSSPTCGLFLRLIKMIRSRGNSHFHLLTSPRGRVGVRAAESVLLTRTGMGQPKRRF